MKHRLVSSAPFSTTFHAYFVGYKIKTLISTKNTKKRINKKKTDPGAAASPLSIVIVAALPLPIVYSGS